MKRLVAVTLLLALIGCATSRPEPTQTITETVTHTHLVDGPFTTVALTQDWTYQGDGSEFSVRLTLSSFALSQAASTEEHPAKPGFTPTGVCGNVADSGMAAGVIKITATKVGSTPLTPEVFLAAKIDHNKLLGNAMIGIDRGGSPDCNQVGRLTLGGIDIALTKPLAEGASVSFPIFLIVHPNRDNQPGPAITADPDRLQAASFTFTTANTDTGKKFKVTDGQSFTFDQTLKNK